MFDLTLFDSIQDYLTKELGYDTANVRSISVSSKGQLTVNLTTHDSFQETVASAHQIRQSYQYLYADTVEGLWSELYSWPRRPARELTVLANQLTGITGMKSQLQSVIVQQFLAPILAERDKLTKYLTGPAPQIKERDPFFNLPNYDDEIPF